MRRHAAGVEQADDCTQLVIRYRGEPDAVSYEYVPTMDDLARATDDLTAALEPVPARARTQLLIAADEFPLHPITTLMATEAGFIGTLMRFERRLRFGKIGPADGEILAELGKKDSRCACRERRARRSWREMDHGDSTETAWRAAAEAARTSCSSEGSASGSCGVRTSRASQ